MNNIIALTLPLRDAGWHKGLDILLKPVAWSCSASRPAFYQSRPDAAKQQVFVLCWPLLTWCSELLLQRPNVGANGSMTDVELGTKGYIRMRDPQAAEELWSFWYNYTEDHCYHGDNC